MTLTLLPIPDPETEALKAEIRGQYEQAQRLYMQSILHAPIGSQAVLRLIERHQKCQMKFNHVA